MKQTLRRVYRIARPITKRRGGDGPWLYLVEHDPAKSKTLRMRASMGVKPSEDLWVELAYYRNKTIMRKTIREIWSNPQFEKFAGGVDKLLSKRKPGYEATLALAMQQQI